MLRPTSSYGAEEEGTFYFFAQPRPGGVINGENQNVPFSISLPGLSRWRAKEFLLFTLGDEWFSIVPIEPVEGGGSEKVKKEMDRGRE
jgi:hypothetical protein